MYPAPAVYGTNVFDGLIELRQRFPARRVLMVTTREDIQHALGPEEMLQLAYRLLDQVVVDPHCEAATVERACQERAILCYEPNWDRTRFDPVLAHYTSSLRRFTLLNSVELVCFDCLSAPTTAASES